MLKRLHDLDATVAFAVLIGAAAAATIILQIALSGSHTTKLETALFSILLFLLSLGFAWVLSRTSFRREFAEGQKAFATAAYRRICEIDLAAHRLISRIGSRIAGSSQELTHEFEVILAIGLGIRQTVRSSIADWADVIGDEIVTMQKIEEIANEQDSLLEAPPRKDPAVDAASVPLSPQLASRLAVLEEQLERLRTSLPPSLQILTRRGSLDDERQRLLQNQSVFRKELAKTGHIRLEGFWEPDGGFGRSVRDLAPGDILRVEIGDAGQRVGALVVSDQSGVLVGVLTNRSREVPTRYHGFVEALSLALERSRFSVRLMSISHEESVGGRIHFSVETTTDGSSLAS